MTFAPGLHHLTFRYLVLQPKRARLVASGVRLLSGAQRLTDGGNVAAGAEDLLLQSCSVFENVAKALSVAGSPL